MIRDAAYLSPGCPSSSRLGALLCRLAIGRPLAMISTLSAKVLLAIEGPVPDGRGFYAQMFVDALVMAAESGGKAIQEEIER